MENEVVLWAVVQFPNNGLATVPTNWFNESEKSVFWPPKNVHVTRAVQERTPPQNDWTKYVNIRHMVTCDSYAKATQLERKYINSECATTDLESEDEASERKKRKSRPNPLYVDGGEEPERGSGKRFAKAPQVNFPEMPASSHFTKAPLSHTVSRAICIEDEELSDPLITNNIFTTGSSSSGLGSPILTTTGAAPEKSSKETKQLFKDITGNKTTAMLAEILVEVKQLGRDMQFVKSEIMNIKTMLHGGKGSEGRDFPMAFPLMTKEQFNDLETVLKEEAMRRKLVARLTLVGGVDSGCMIRRMASAVLSNQLACLFNWKGKGGKRAFESTSLLDCMFAAARHYDKSITELAFGDVVKKWLRYAPERKHGLKRKALGVSN
ncbi:unnamed protein product [Knipowitschia caucasica]